MASKPSWASTGIVAAFVITAAVPSVMFSNGYVSGVQSWSVERFTDIFIPTLTAVLHLTLARSLRRSWFAGLVGLDALCSVSLATYNSYFRENLDIHVAIANASEGMAVAGYALSLVPLGIAALYTAAVVIEVGLQPAVRAAIRPRHLALLWAPTAAMSLLGLWKVPPNRAPLVTDYTLSVKLHGYYSALAFDLWFSGPTPSDEEMHAQLGALQASDPVPIPEFGLDPPDGIRRIVAVQVESLDWSILGWRHGGRPVVPYLDELRHSSIALKLNAKHSGGSGTAGADFQFLTQRLPIPNYPTFRIAGLDYSMALPRLIHRLGGETIAFHGNDGSMWSRRSAFEQMGFTGTMFAEDFSRIDSRWGVSDSTFFAESLEVIRGSRSRRGFYFLVSLSSHGPFDYVSNPVWAGDDRVTMYFNSINYLDRHLRRFVESLPDSTLLVVYGDHASGVGNAEYRSVDHGEEYVPGLITLIVDGQARPPSAQPPLDSQEPEGLDIRSLGLIVAETVRRSWTLAEPGETHP